MRSVRRRCADHVVDTTDRAENETAIYALADPRDVEVVRYIGQTRSPRARYLQHLTEARLWLPDEVPWWVKSVQMRPLYHWIRELYSENQRLPLMMIVAWTESAQAREEEGRHIREYLRHNMPLLNRETETFHRKQRFPGASIPLTRHAKD